MNVFVATEKTQGQRASDFCFVPNGELVTFGMVCDGNDAIDGGCGCQRSLTGIKCLKGTTTVEVVDFPHMVETDLAEVVKRSYVAGGWGKLTSNEELAEWSREEAKELARLAAEFEVGAIVERRRNKFQTRQVPGPLDPAKLQRSRSRSRKGVEPCYSICHTTTF